MAEELRHKLILAILCLRILLTGAASPDWPDLGEVINGHDFCGLDPGAQGRGALKIDLTGRNRVVHPRIIGGWDEFLPWTVKVWSQKIWLPSCTGTIIAEHYAIATGTCCSHVVKDVYKMFYGGRKDGYISGISYVEYDIDNGHKSNICLMRSGDSLLKGRAACARIPNSKAEQKEWRNYVNMQVNAVISGWGPYGYDKISPDYPLIVQMGVEVLQRITNEGIVTKGGLSPHTMKPTCTFSPVDNWVDKGALGDDSANLNVRVKSDDRGYWYHTIGIFLKDTYTGAPEEKTCENRESIYTNLLDEFIMANLNTHMRLIKMKIEQDTRGRRRRLGRRTGRARIGGEDDYASGENYAYINEGDYNDEYSADYE